MEKALFKKNDIILLVSMLAVLAVIVILLAITKSDGEMVVVSVDSKVVASFPLNEDRKYEIEGYDGGRNVLVIKDGVAYMSEASCPDHLCMNMGRISKVGQSVICLPNRVVIEIKGKDTEKEYDVITS